MLEHRTHPQACPTGSPQNQRRAVRGLLSMMLMLCCVLLHPATTQAQDNRLNADDAQVLADLGSEDFALRQYVTQRMLQDNGLTQDDLDRLFAKSQTPEQRHRLLRIARHHDIRRMIEVRFQDQASSGSMGLSHAVVRVQVTEDDESPAESRAGIMAALTLPGFPAYATMHPGDVIIEFDGQPMPDKVTGPMFQQMIQGRRAGDTIDLTIVRSGIVDRIEMTLSNSQALGEVYHSSGVVLNSPYREQWAKTREAMLSLINNESQRDDEVKLPERDPTP